MILKSNWSKALGYDECGVPLPDLWTSLTNELGKTVSKSVLPAIAILLGTFFAYSSSAEETDAGKNLQPLIAQTRPALTTIRVQGRDGTEIGIGTGFVLDTAGLVATNFHVIGEGRHFSVESSDGQLLPVLSVEASDLVNDLAIIRVDPGDSRLHALDLADDSGSEQGMRVLAFGNPLGLQNSVVEGIISAKRKVDGREMLQLAMPIEPGNSGGPVIDLAGRVHGIVNMKSAIDDNLGFAIPIRRLVELRNNPNPVAFDRWVRIGSIDEQQWQPLFGANWQQRGGGISASGLGDGFGGRSLLLSRQAVPERPFEIAVSVRLDDEAGAAGIAFYSDGGQRHYGFYPSAGRMRLSCFLGSSVLSWQVLQEVATDHYLPGQWNDLKVRLEQAKVQCFVNGQLIIESTDSQLTSGRVGLAKFRDTEPEFRRFRIGTELPSQNLTAAAEKWFADLKLPRIDLESMGTEQIEALGQSGELSSRELIRQAQSLEQQAQQLRLLAGDVRRANVIARLADLSDLDASQRLLTGTLLIANLDNPEIDIEAYSNRIDEMANEILDTLPADPSLLDRREALHHYLFEENGFHGSRSEYYHPANSHLNRVIDDREGLPITMSILYIELGRRLGLRIEGVGLPGHFVVRHVSSDDQQQLVDVFEKGELLSREDAERIVIQHAGRRAREEDLRASTATEILTRVLNNMLAIAADAKDAEAMLRYCDAMVAINPDQVDVRVMRAQLRGSTGRIRAAIEDVDWAIEQDPSPRERAALEQVRAALEERRQR